jgi:hypothetical protein
VGVSIAGSEAFLSRVNPFIVENQVQTPTPTHAQLQTLRQCNALNIEDRTSLSLTTF